MPDERGAPAASIPVIASDAHLAHDGLTELYGGELVPCFESPARAAEIRRALEAAEGYRLEHPAEHGVEPILAVHDAELVDLLEHAWDDAVAGGETDGTRPVMPHTFQVQRYVGPMRLDALPVGRHHRLGAFCFDAATPIVAGTYAAARASVDIALTALDRVVGGARLAYGLCRPPGHHAGRNLIGGYCFFNNAAIVAQRLVDLGASRVAILDLDYHHGNGTQQVFWARGDVLYVSLHGDPGAAYPYFSGRATEVGEGTGAGATRNLPLPRGTDGAAYLAALDEALGAIRTFGPDAPVVISIGFDTYRADPICDFALETADYARVGARVGELGMPVVALQEGGYAIEAIGANAVAFLGGLNESLASGGRAR